MPSRLKKYIKRHCRWMRPGPDPDIEQPEALATPVSLLLQYCPKCACGAAGDGPDPWPRRGEHSSCHRPAPPRPSVDLPRAAAAPGHAYLGCPDWPASSTWQKRTKPHTFPRTQPPPALHHAVNPDARTGARHPHSLSSLSTPVLEAKHQNWLHLFLY
jgi:hypothetical protein